MMEDNTTQLRGEVTDLLGQIDEEGLLFLKQQASTLIYNATVEEMNRKKQESFLENHKAKSTEEAQEMDGVVEDQEKPHQPKVDGLYIDMTNINKNYVNLCNGNVRVFFTLDELDTLVYIAENAKSPKEAPLLLYRWMKRERGDYLVDNGILSFPSAVIDALAAYLLKD